MFFFQNLINNSHSDIIYRLRPLFDYSQSLSECKQNAFYLSTCDRYQTILAEDFVTNQKYIVKSKVFPQYVYTNEVYDLLKVLDVLSEFDLPYLMKFYGPLSCLSPEVVKSTTHYRHGLAALLGKKNEFCTGSVDSNKLVLFFYEYREGAEQLKTFIARQRENENIKPILKKIYFIVAIIIRYLQTEVGFVHNDLNLRNVLIESFPTEQTLTLPFGIQVKTRYAPFIIDFDDSLLDIKNKRLNDMRTLHTNIANALDIMEYAEDEREEEKYNVYWREDDFNMFCDTMLEQLGFRDDSVPRLN